MKFRRINLMTSQIIIRTALSNCIDSVLESLHVYTWLDSSFGFFDFLFGLSFSVAFYANNIFCLIVSNFYSG